METLYLISLMMGGFCLIVSLFAGTESDADLALRTDTEQEASAPAQPTAASAGSALSFRTVVFFFAIFGLAGVLLTAIQLPGLLTMGLAIACGLIAARLGRQRPNAMDISTAGPEDRDVTYNHHIRNDRHSHLPQTSRSPNP